MRHQYRGFATSLQELFAAGSFKRAALGYVPIFLKNRLHRIAPGTAALCSLVGFLKM